MNILKQFGILLLIWIMGEYISSLLSMFLVIPGSIVGMILLFIFLKIKLIDIKNIEKVSDFLLDNIAFFFIPAGVGLIKSLDIIKENALILGVIITISTIIVMYITSLIVQLMIKSSK